MHIKFVMKKVIENIFGRKLSFLLMVVVMGITFYLLFTTVGMYFRSNYVIYDTKRVFSSSNLVNMSVQVTGFEDDDYYYGVERLLQNLKARYQDKVTYFMYMQEQEIQTDGVTENRNILFIDGNMGLCSTAFTDELPESDTLNDCIRCYMCRNMKDKYPPGTVFQNMSTDTHMMVAGYFDPGSRWIAEPLFAQMDAGVTLDDYIVSEMDRGYFDSFISFYDGVLNNIYVSNISKGELADVKMDMNSLADEEGLMYYSDTLEESIQEERDSNKEIIRAIGIMIAFAVLVSVSALFTASLADVFSRRTDIAIMSVNGVSPVDLYMMLLIENIIKFVIAFGIAVSIYSFIDIRSVTDRIVTYRMTFPVMGVCGILCMVIITTIAQSTVKQKKLLSLMGGARL